VIWRILRAMWRSGLLRFSPIDFIRALFVWFRCGSSYAALAGIAAIRFPERVALHDDEGTLTFAELAHQADALALALLRENGLRAGQQAALLCRNHRGFVIGLLALSRLGVDTLALGTESPAASLQRVLARQRQSFVLHDAEFTSLLEQSAPDLPRRCVAKLPTAVDGALPRPPRAAQLIVLTSGSTGISKGIRRRTSLRLVLPALAGLLEGLPIEMHRPAVLAIPLNHGYGLTALAMSLALAAPLHVGRRYEIGPLLARLPENAGPVLITVPTLLQRWLRDSPKPISLAALISGSAPLDASLCVKALDVLGPVLFNLYGSTEAGLIAMANPHALRAAPGSVGQPLPGTEVRLVDANGSGVPVGQLGRVRVRGPLVLGGGDDGWFDTGDLGRLDAGGRLFVCGRADSMFISGGENVYPEETEEALHAHPAVADAAVTVVPDAEFGQRMLAHVVVRAGEALDDEGLRAWLRERLERFKLPREISFVTEIPRNALGKIDRAALKRSA